MEGKETKELQQISLDTCRADMSAGHAMLAEEYRYLSLPGARIKAELNHYQGSMFTWESAWLDE